MFYPVSEEVMEVMNNARDEAAAVFWRYPDVLWQLRFEEDWFRKHGWEMAAEKARIAADYEEAAY